MEVVVWAGVCAQLAIIKEIEIIWGKYTISAVKIVVVRLVVIGFAYRSRGTLNQGFTREISDAFRLDCDANVGVSPVDGVADGIELEHVFGLLIGDERHGASDVFAELLVSPVAPALELF